MTALSTTKLAVHAACRSLIQARIVDLEAEIAEARLSAQSDTKSSAGDKHETGRAMVQLEIEKQQSSLATWRSAEAVLGRLDPGVGHDRVQEGALVQLDSGLLYIAAGIGRVQAEGIDVQVVGPQAPLARLLWNKPVGSAATFNGRTHTVLGIA